MRALSKLGVSEQAACCHVNCSRATIQYVSRREPDDPAVIDSIRKIANQRLRFGRRRVHFLMGCEGFDISERRFRLMYRAQNLQVRARKKRHVLYVRGTARLVAAKSNQCWSLDFLHHILLNRRKFCVLDIIDRAGMLAWCSADVVPSRMAYRRFVRVQVDAGCKAEVRELLGSHFIGVTKSKMKRRKPTNRPCLNLGHAYSLQICFRSFIEGGELL